MIDGLSAWWPSTKQRSKSAITAFTRSVRGFVSKVMMIRRAKDQCSSQRSAKFKAVPAELSHKASATCREQRGREAHVSKYQAYKLEVCGSRRRGHRFSRWDKPDAPRQNVDMHMWEIMPGWRDWHLKKRPACLSFRPGAMAREVEKGGQWGHHVMLPP